MAYILGSSDRETLERSQAREIYNTFCHTKDRELVVKQVKYSAKWFGQDGARRILGYVKQLEGGQLD
jgi:hypothetical protein